MPAVGQSRGALGVGTAACAAAEPALGGSAWQPAPRGRSTPSFGSTTYRKEIFAGVCQHLPEAFLILFIDELVSIHPLSFVEPEAHQVHGGFQAFGSGEQQTLTNT